MKYKANTKYIDADGAIHLFDISGNHFIDGRCYNSLVGEGNIGDSYPDPSELTEYKEETK